MSRHTPRHGGQHPPPLEAAGEVIYAEDRAGLEWRRTVIPAVVFPVIFAAVSVPFALASSSVSVVLLLIPMLAAGFMTMISVLGLIAVWPVGIRIDSAGIRIGGLLAWERRQRSGRWPPRRPFHVASQGRAVFSCPWEGVRALYLVRSRAEFTPVKKQWLEYRKRTEQLRGVLGFLGFVSAGLVIVTDPDLARSDPATFRTNRGRFGLPVHGVMSPTWVVPTRHPDALRAALARVPGAPPVHDGLPAGQQFWFSEIEAARAALQAWQAQHPSPPPQPGT